MTAGCEPVALGGAGRSWPCARGQVSYSAQESQSDFENAGCFIIPSNLPRLAPAAHPGAGGWPARRATLHCLRPASLPQETSAADGIISILARLYGVLPEVQWRCESCRGAGPSCAKHAVPGLWRQPPVRFLWHPHSTLKSAYKRAVEAHHIQGDFFSWASAFPFLSFFQSSPFSSLAHSLQRPFATFAATPLPAPPSLPTHLPTCTLSVSSLSYHS